MKKDNLLKYIVAPYNIVSASIAIFFMWQGFWNPDPNTELIAFVLRIIVFFGFILLLLTNVSFYLKTNDYQVIQSTVIRVLGFVFNIGAGTEIMIYVGYKQRFSLELGFHTWNYVLTIVNNLDDTSTLVFGFNIVSIVLAIFFYKLIMVEKNKKQPI